MAHMASSDSEVKTCSKTCLKNYESLKKQYDDLLAKQLQTKFEAATYKRGLDNVEAQLVTYRKNDVLFSEEVVVFKREVGCKQYKINMLKTEFEKVKQEKDGIDFKIEKFYKASKDLDQLLGSQITDKSKKGLGYSAVPPPHPLIYNRPNKLDLSYSGLDEFKEPEFKGYGPENSKQESNVVCENKSDNSKKNSNKSLVKEQVSQDKSSFVEGYGPNTDDEEQDESKPKSEKKTVIPTADKKEFAKHKNNEKPFKRSVRPVNTAHPKTAVHSAKSKTHFSKQAQSTAKRPFYKQTTLTRRSVYETKRHYYTGRHYAVNTARSYTRQVNAVRVKGVNAGKPQHDDKGFVDSGCSRHMIGDIAYLSDFKQFDGYVAFGGGAYGGKITGIIHLNWLLILIVIMLEQLKIDETSEILKNFIKEIENLVDLKVKIIRSDNGTEFKNKVMDDFCREKDWSANGCLDIEFSNPIYDYDQYRNTISNNSASTSEENGQDCIMMPIWKDTSYFDSPTKDVENGEPKTADDPQKQVEDGPNNENTKKERFSDDNSTKYVNATGQHVNTATPKV
ncbi:putative ribonuclease H-like domain-containing protein [Tanacetum coccineum]